MWNLQVNNKGVYTVFYLDFLIYYRIYIYWICDICGFIVSQILSEKCWTHALLLFIFHAHVCQPCNHIIGNEMASRHSWMMLEYAISCDTQLFRRKGDKRSSIRAPLRTCTHTRARAARVARSPINYRDISRRTRVFAVTLCTCTPQCNIRVMHSCGPAHSARPAYKRKSSRALSPGSRRSSPPHTSFELQDPSVRKKKRKKIRNIRNVTLLFTSSCKDFSLENCKRHDSSHFREELIIIIDNVTRTLWDRRSILVLIRFTACRVVQDIDTRCLPRKIELFRISKWTVTLINSLFGWTVFAENEGWWFCLIRLMDLPHIQCPA